MARVQVVLTTCDRCPTEERQPLGKGIKRGEYQLPKDWLNVSAKTSKGEVFDIDLCPDCKGVVIDAAGRGNNRSLKAVG